MDISKTVNQSVNENVNRDVNKHVNRHVSREPNFRYTTMLLKKTKENVRKIPNSTYTTILLKNANDKSSAQIPIQGYTARPNHKQTYTKHPRRPQNRQIPENWGSRGPGPKKRKDQYKTNGFSLFCTIFIGNILYDNMFFFSNVLRFFIFAQGFLVKVYVFFGKMILSTVL